MFSLHFLLYKIAVLYRMNFQRPEISVSQTFPLFIYILKNVMKPIKIPKYIFENY